MTTAVATVIGAIVRALKTAPYVSNNVFRARLRPLPTDWPTAVVVRPRGSVKDNPDIGSNTFGIWDTAIEVECYAHGSADPDLVVDPLLQAVANRLLADRTLGGTVGGLDIAVIGYDFDATADTAACATITLTIRHATAANSLAAL